MEARLYHLSSVDVLDLETFECNEGSCRFELTIEAGLKNSKGVDLFYSEVVVENTRDQRLTGERISCHGGRIFIKGPYSYKLLWNFVAKTISESPGETWADIALSLSCIGRWEWTGKRYPT